MAEIKSGARYVLTNSLIGSDQALASTSMNDSVVVTSSSSSDAGQSWYFQETSTAGYYRLHTSQKGEYFALDVLNYNGKNTIDLHLYSVQENTGQYWQVKKQEDGSHKINNKYTGSDMYLDIVKDTLQPTMAAKDGPGQRWTLSEIGSIPTPTPSAARAATASISGITANPSSTSSVSTSTSSMIPSANSSDGLSKGVIGGIVAGSVVGVIAVVIGAVIFWKIRKTNRAPVIQNPPAISSRPMLHIGRDDSP
ncbi:hypothetical protein FB567DRAFT_623467 [Paraphoma chrysanthemicola]|uniref:Ricin B lectin domain-containing protein n=1 Tax=Paraphoma chrysanthemicola TaxID=798071 RepID=A0A8K0W4T0_9PLEO|nr:hypothetical protein FB567DRAFT_623467 [Paraphoma chrysanthemicola]